MRKVEKNIIEITQEVTIGDHILEKGDKIKILKESRSRAAKDLINECWDNEDDNSSESMIAHYTGQAVANSLSLQAEYFFSNENIQVFFDGIADSLEI